MWSVEFNLYPIRFTEIMECSYYVLKEYNSGDFLNPAAWGDACPATALDLLRQQPSCLRFAQAFGIACLQIRASAILESTCILEQGPIPGEWCGSCAPWECGVCSFAAYCRMSVSWGRVAVQG